MLGVLPQCVDEAPETSLQFRPASEIGDNHPPAAEQSTNGSTLSQLLSVLSHRNPDQDPSVVTPRASEADVQTFERRSRDCLEHRIVDSARTLDD